MQYLRHVPGPPLDASVDYFWLCIDGQADRKERILPSGTVELVVNLREDEVRIHDPAQPQRCTRFPGAAVSGTYSGVFVVDAMQHASMMGIHFKPGGAFPFLGVPAGEVRDTHADLAELWGRSANELRERLCMVSSPRERFRILREILIGRLCRSPKCHQAVPIAIGLLGPGGTGGPVSEIARETGLCQRRFIQLFTAQVGLTPKVFARILRFQRARTLAEQAEKPDWAQVALNCGYFDQSHLINDFQEFSGLSPTEYVRQHRQEDRLLRNHVPLPGR